jgi:hypothetical protein
MTLHDIHPSCTPYCTTTTHAILTWARHETLDSAWDSWAASLALQIVSKREVNEMEDRTGSNVYTFYGANNRWGTGDVLGAEDVPYLVCVTLAPGSAPRARGLAALWQRLTNGA